jgi:hypothetical protein
MVDLLELAMRCERSPGPDKDLDLDIVNAVTSKPGWIWHDDMHWTITRNDYGSGAVGNPICSIDAYTASIDHAVTLIPDGWFFSGLDQQSPAVRVWTEGNIAYHSPGLDGICAATPALALCAAALRAQARVLADVGSGQEP